MTISLVARGALCSHNTVSLFCRWHACTLAYCILVALSGLLTFYIVIISLDNKEPQCACTSLLTPHTCVSTTPPSRRRLRRRFSLDAPWRVSRCGRSVWCVCRRSALAVLDNDDLQHHHQTHTEHRAKRTRGRAANVRRMSRTNRH